MIADSKERRLRLMQPESPVEQALQEFSSGGRDTIFVAVTTENTFGLPVFDMGDDPFTVKIEPEATRKVSGEGTWTYGAPEVWATKIWPIAVFWALTGAQHSALSPDTGVCVHPVPNPFDKDGAPAQVVTLMASWDHHWHGAGVVWFLPASEFDFDNPDRSWIYRTRRNVTLPKNMMLRAVSAKDLPFLPVECRPDETMLSVGAEPFNFDLPRRGPHKPFDPRYACGVTGGSFMVVGDDIYTIGDSWIPLDRREPEFNVRSNDRSQRLLSYRQPPATGALSFD